MEKKILCESCRFGAKKVQKGRYCFVLNLIAGDVTACKSYVYKKGVEVKTEEEPV